MGGGDVGVMSIRLMSVGVGVASEGGAPHAPKMNRHINLMTTSRLHTLYLAQAYDIIGSHIGDGFWGIKGDIFEDMLDHIEGDIGQNRL